MVRGYAIPDVRARTGNGRVHGTQPLNHCATKTNRVWTDAPVRHFLFDISWMILRKQKAVFFAPKVNAAMNAFAGRPLFKNFKGYCCRKIILSKYSFCLLQLLLVSNKK